MTLENTKNQPFNPRTPTVATSPIPAPEPALNPFVDDRLMYQVWTSEFHLPTLIVADELGLFSLLAKAPATVRHVQTHLPLGPRGAEMLLGLLATLGFLVQCA